LEILVVLALLVLLAGFAWPALENQITAAEVPESAGHVRDMLFMARSEAALQHRRVRVRFAPEEQQPYIEYEADPILRPGEWDPLPSPWAREPMLLAGVQVHEIRPGRPEYLEPLALNTNADQGQQQGQNQDQTQSDSEAADSSEFDSGAAQSKMDTGQDPIDENRPPIVFEADGSTSWATIIVSKRPPEEPLEEKDEQLWVILDGRTGLAEVREQVTEAQLADESFYIAREKLELPDQTDVSNLSIDVNSDSGSGFASGGSPGTGLGVGNRGRGASGSSQDAANGLPGLGGALDPGAAAGDSGGKGDQNGLGGSSTGNPVQSGRGDGDQQGNQADADNGSSDLDQALNNSDLTDQERQNIRKTLGRGGGG